MESVIRGLVVYVFLLLVFRVAGKRTLAQSTPFELVLLLIIAETVEGAIVDSDHSLTNAFLLIITLVGTSILLSVVKHHSKTAARWLDGLPVRVVRDGKWDDEVADMERVDREEVLQSGREGQGVGRMDQVAHAVVEHDGKISVVPSEDR